MKAIHDLIGERVVDILKQYCHDTVPDPQYAATEIRQGLFQDDPVKRRISIMVNPADPEDTQARPSWTDNYVKRDDIMGYNGSFFIGGGESRWRRFVIELRVYLVETQEDRPKAREIGMWQFGRIQHALREMRAFEPPLKDDFGEEAFFMIVEKTVVTETGGPPASHIWTGKIFLQVYTETMD